MRLELTWPNKDQFLLVPKDDNGKPVWVAPDHPAASEVRLADFTGAYGQIDNDNPYADNLLFTGDSLDVLRILNETAEFRREYRGKVKLVYIDPPFNTGATFEHYDDWMEHSTWLSFMRDRLLLIKDLLAPDGTVWVHLDNFEAHRMRVLADEVFGADNFINTVVWKRTGAKAAARRGMGTMYDNILIYGAGATAALRPVLLPYGDEYVRTKYSNTDDRGPYQLTSLLASGARTGPSGEVWQGCDPTAKGNHWRAPQADAILGEAAKAMTTLEKLDALLVAGYIQLPRNGAGTPRFKFYLDGEGGVALGDLWTDISVLNSQSKERTGYDTQKPEALMQRIISMATVPGDIVVDVFGGSGTTAVAASKSDRRWVTGDDLAKTTDEFMRPRLAEVADTLDGQGFRTLVVAPSMYEVTPFGVVLADWATNGRFSRAVAGQLGFEFQPDAAPFCGARGRMRLAVLDGALGVEEVRSIVAALPEGERVTIVAKAVMPDAESVLAALSKGSRVRKAPRDVLAPATQRAQRARAVLA